MKALQIVFASLFALGMVGVLIAWMFSFAGGWVGPYAPLIERVGICGYGLALGSGSMLLAVTLRRRRTRPENRLNPNRH
ncbi:MAG TPA: hypothetical protein VG944_08975 [Fimbriimonas sp.]|nr:hypothetical protein [Fimbriimonas sp.]